MNRIFSSTMLFVAILLAVVIPATGQDAGDISKSGDPGVKVTRVGVVLPKVDLRDARGEVEPGEALRSTYAALLNSDTIELVAMESKLASLALEEAGRLECDFILNVNLKQEAGKSGGGGLFGKVLRDTGNRATWEASSSVPYGGGAGGRIASSTARSAIINTGYTMTDMSIDIKKNDKFSLDYGLITAKGQPVKDNSFESKAKKKNDDTVLMGLIEKSANDIAKAILNNRDQ